MGLLARSADPDESEYDPIIPLERQKQLADGALLAPAPRIDWPRLLRRSLAQDVLVCPNCAGRLQVLDVVAKPDEARREIAELGHDVSGREVTATGSSHPAGPRTDPAPGVAGRRNPAGPRSPPARAPSTGSGRAGPDAPGACIRSS
ncbi:MAG: hypothetical protein HY905_18185 [Deltaproteobacteria bacterium]|nr:hypothetical protein [Deltaproteobacteria bacterium]